MPEHKQRSTEYYGVGQSGYAAGRVEDDPALDEQIEIRNVGDPRDGDQLVAADRGDDDRFTGRGGMPWAPEDEKDEAPAVRDDREELEALERGTSQ